MAEKQEINEAPQQSSCPGDCMHCNIIQRSYCAAQMARNTQDMVAALRAEVNALAGLVRELTRGEILAAPKPEVPASDAQ